MLDIANNMQSVLEESMKTLLRVNPISEFRTMDDMFDHLFGRSPAVSPPASATHLPLDILEQEGKFIIRASVPGTNPADLEIQIENNILTIRGETKSEYKSEDAKFYRREVSYGAFARSIRLPEKLDLEQVDAAFNHGFVTISIPKLEEEKPKAVRVNVRTVNEVVATEAESNN